MKQIRLFALVFLLLASTCTQNAVTTSVQAVTNPHQLTIGTVDEPDSVDPAHASNDYGEELVFNVYERLISYDRESVDGFIPLLATGWSISSDGLTYTFKIREGVQFHNGETLTTEDVEFSFERVMVHDKYGISRMLYDPLLNIVEANLTDPTFGEKIDNAVQRNATHVWFNLVEPYAPFLEILRQPLASIVNKRFCVEHGDWPGTWNNWTNYHNLSSSPLDKPEPVMCGTGPYMFDYWTERVEWSVVMFDDYWRGWPAGGCRGYAERVVIKVVLDWVTRKGMFLNGELDIVKVEEANISEVFGQPSVRCIYPLPELSCTGFFFNFDINPTSEWMGVPGGLPLGTFNESGIPPDFFCDVDVRKGFAYSINYTEFLQAIHNIHEATHPGTPVLEGMLLRNPEEEKYEFNLTKGEEHFRKAWNGELWSRGFTFTVVHNEGQYDLPRKVICEALKTNIERLNEKFHIEIYMIDKWADVYIPMMIGGMLPLFQIGLRVATVDPHSLIYAFMHSEAQLVTNQQYCNATVDALLESGLRTLNETRRREIYYALQKVYFEECSSVTIYQAMERHWERDRVQGWYYNPTYPGLYFYHLWKEDLPLEDLNSDGAVNTIDLGVAAEAFASYYRVGTIDPRWNSRADLNMDQEVNILDIATIALKFGS